MPQKQHVMLTCYDHRIDKLVAEKINVIRSQGGQLAGKDILRIPGGVHLLAGKTDCRKAFYEMLSGYQRIAKTTVFHLLPHTNCQYCGIHFPEKLGNGTRSDLRFHLKSAEKMLAGAKDHFLQSPDDMPELNVSIILTIDQRIISIEQARELLPHVPEEHGHGMPCCVHSGHDEIRVC